MIDLVDEFIADQDWLPITIRWYRRMLTLFFEFALRSNLTEKTINSGQFTKFLNEMRGGGASYSTRNWQTSMI